ncbi:uncharacterized protein N0V89_004211 [Didymosphaeria variabile]|uniref:RCC1/BLIP-II n=1 Tax=Didymosphaeria variabile TaxID=1932322 RepID=A0A9W8XRE7_9PLEO|nr:uncharacterized protein N0V89_004211 [Didymosphaeria variabile]KAJ4356181.1 hypothetical protein N0V89_004211 [Didymosphaeria variabile]
MHTNPSPTISAATTNASIGTLEPSPTDNVPFNTPSAFRSTTLDPAPTASSPASTPTAAPVDQLETGVKIGIGVLAGFLGLILIAVLVEACYLRRRRREKALQRAVQEVESGERAEMALANLKGSEEIVVLESRTAIVYDQKHAFATPRQPRTAEEVAEQVVQALIHADKGGAHLKRALDDIVGGYGWTEKVAEWALAKLEQALGEAEKLQGPLKEAYIKACDAAVAVEGFVKEHPVFVTVIAVGVLVTIAPWVLEVLGFAELGPVEDAWTRQEYLGSQLKKTLASMFDNCMIFNFTADVVNAMQSFTWTTAALQFQLNSFPIALRTKLHQTESLTHHTVKVDSAYYYYGTSLLAAQITTVTSLSTSFAQCPVFFGRRDTSGVLGFIVPSNSSLSIFSTPEEIAQGADPILTTSFASTPWTISDIHFTASDAVFAHLQPQGIDTETSTNIKFSSLQHLQNFLEVTSQHQDDLSDGIKRTIFTSTRSTTNTATLTTLSPKGQVKTLATDRRFARAAGRDPDHSTSIPQPVPFLGETAITKIAAGGLYTAALADDGELYLWGQAAAGSPGELHCLAKEGEDDDEYVRTVDAGKDVRVVDVAVGAAYVLVAVESEGKREVWGAGDNQYGALGLGAAMDGREFVEVFVPVKALEGKRVKQMVCAGMSSFVVVDADN